MVPVLQAQLFAAIDAAGLIEDDARNNVDANVTLSITDEHARGIAALASISALQIAAIASVQEMLESEVEQRPPVA